MGLSTEDQDSLVSLAFSVQSNPRAYAVLLGAGVSVASGIPGAWGVVTSLISDAAKAVDRIEPEDPEAWYEAKYGTKPTYQRVLEEFAPSPEERHRLLRAHFDPQSNGGRTPTAAHKAIARLVRAGKVRVLLTLNFDKLMEDALASESVHYTLIDTPSKLGASLSPLHTLDCIVVHLHGDYLSPLAMLNTDSELESYKPALQGFIREVLANYGLIVAGWSATYDPALKALIEEHYPSRYTPTWIEPYGLSPEATDLVRQLKATRVTADADEAFGFLADSVASMAEKRTRHPLTVPTAVATAKRELSRETVSIRLHDTLHGELNRIASLPETTVPENPQQAAEALKLLGDVNAMGERTAEAAKVATALSACLAYWGALSEHRKMLTDAVLRLSTPLSGHPQPDLGGMSRVAGQSLFYGAGVAAVAAERWELLVHLLCLETPGRRNRAATERASDVLVAPGPMGRLGIDPFAAVSPILNDALGIGDQPVERAWERFEILRLAHTILSKPNFSERARPVDTADEAVKAIDEGDGSPTGAMTEKRRNAWWAGMQSLKELGGRVRADTLHLEAAEDYDEQMQIRFSPEVRRLKADHWTLASLVDAGFAESEKDLVLALRAVDVAVHLASHSPGQPMFFDDPRWLDAGTYTSQPA